MIGDAARLDRHRGVAAVLAELDDAELAAATPLGVGIGGQTARLEVGGVPVFVKRIPLTGLERQPGHVGSTANLFGLPAFYQYGVGSTGFGAWRELAAHHTTTEWVRAGVSPRFPLLHHWRVLPSCRPGAQRLLRSPRRRAQDHGVSGAGTARASAGAAVDLDRIRPSGRSWRRPRRSVPRRAYAAA